MNTLPAKVTDEPHLIFLVYVAMAKRHQEWIAAIRQKYKAAMEEMD